MEDKPETRKMVEKSDFNVYCFACSKSGPYYRIDPSSGTLKRVSATMRKTERGYAHVDCLA